MTHKGRIAVVTGAGRGPGAEIAARLAARGATVVCADLSMPSATVAAIGTAAVGVAGDGITCNAVLPGLTNTPATAPMPDELRRATWGGQAIQRFADPADDVGPVLFLTSDAAAFMTGQALVVDGGQYRVG